MVWTISKSGWCAAESNYCRYGGFDWFPIYKTSLQHTGRTFDCLIRLWLQSYIRCYRLLIVLQLVDSLMSRSVENQLNKKRKNSKKLVRKTLLESDQWGLSSNIRFTKVIWIAFFPQEQWIKCVIRNWNCVRANQDKVRRIKTVGPIIIINISLKQHWWTSTTVWLQ